MMQNNDSKQQAAASSKQQASSAMAAAAAAAQSRCAQRRRINPACRCPMHMHYPPHARPLPFLPRVARAQNRGHCNKRAKSCGRLKEMAKSKNHTSHNQTNKAHKNGIKRTLRQKHQSCRGMDPKFLRNQR